MADELKRAYRAYLGCGEKVGLADLYECVRAAFLFIPVPVAFRTELQ